MPPSLTAAFTTSAAVSATDSALSASRRPTFYDLDFGQKVCSAYERHLRTAEFVQGLRVHKHGSDITAQHERGYIPEYAREEYERKQEEGLRAWREDMTDDGEPVQPSAKAALKADQAEDTATHVENPDEHKGFKRRRLLDNGHKHYEEPRGQRKRRRKSR
ncbi:hypothetical protein LTR04_003381 [Oleoguttula sp. CCFEE 6159]|nr:hypothetical protein LTR04_003381 [Oleoguttula sp. CCFEE 6159]